MRVLIIDPDEARAALVAEGLSDIQPLEVRRGHGMPVGLEIAAAVVRVNINDVGPHRAGLRERRCGRARDRSEKVTPRHRRIGVIRCHAIYSSSLGLNRVLFADRQSQRL